MQFIAKAKERKKHTNKQKKKEMTFFVKCMMGSLEHLKSSDVKVQDRGSFLRGLGLVEVALIHDKFSWGGGTIYKLSLVACNSGIS